jgi:pyruvate/2-oxoglutarate dehydrogenase complex dihydrolipoamide acyltransferase (E2) component
MNNFKRLSYPRSRRATFDVGIIGSSKHHIVALLEIDVTEAKTKIREAVNTGKKIGFTSWFMKVIGNTVADNTHCHAINYKAEKQIAFDEVDIAIPIEREVNGVKVPLVTIVRSTNKKTPEAINSEIQSAIHVPINDEKVYVLTKRKHKNLTGLFFYLPQWARLMAWKWILKNPFTIKDNMGTVMVTNIGQYGKIAGWIIPKSLHNLCFGIGSVVRKPWVVKDDIAIRDILHLTILFDHDVIDGAPAARFTKQLVENLEEAMEL